MIIREVYYMKSQLIHSKPASDLYGLSIRHSKGLSDITYHHRVRLSENSNSRFYRYRNNCMSAVGNRYFNSNCASYPKRNLKGNRGLLTPKFYTQARYHNYKFSRLYTFRYGMSQLVEDIICDWEEDDYDRTTKSYYLELHPEEYYE